MIRDKLKDIQGVDDIPPLQVPGNFPHRGRYQPTKTSATTRETQCTACGTCADLCPTAAITVTDTVATDPDSCILCCVCVKNCPSRARVMEEPRVRQIAEFLTVNYSERKEPEIFV